MKRIFAILAFFTFTATLCGQTRISAGDRQKVTTFEVSGTDLNLQIENDILRTADLSGLGGGSGAFPADAIVVGDGVTDNTAAINTALATYNAAYLLGNVITTSAITLGDNQRLEGPGTLTNNTSDVLVIDGTNTHIELGSISSTAGHILTFTDNTFNFSVRNTKLSALNTGKSQVYVRGAVGVYDMVIEHCYFETGPNHTVPMVDVVVTAENFNENRFINNTFQTNGSPTAEVIHIETTAAAFWLSGNEVSGNLFEIPTAGAIHVYSVAGMKMHNNTVYDLPTSGAATGDMIYIDNTTGGLNSAGVTISDYHRVAGDLTTNTVYDINNQGAYAGSISVYDAVGLASSQLLFNGLSGHVVQGGYYISNDGGGSGFPTKSELDTFAELDALVADQTLTYINASEFGSTVDNRIPIFRGNDGGIEGDGRLTWNNGSVKVGTGAFNMDFGSNNVSFNGTSNEGFIDQTGLRGIIVRTENSGGAFENTLTIEGGTDTNSVDVLQDLNVGGDIITPGLVDGQDVSEMAGNILEQNDISLTENRNLSMVNSAGRTFDIEIGTGPMFRMTGAASPNDYRLDLGNVSQGLNYTVNTGWTFTSPFTLFSNSTPPATANGRMYYNTSNQTVYYYNGNSWVAIGTSTSLGTANQSIPAATTRYVDIDDTSDLIIREDGLTDMVIFNGDGTVDFPNAVPTIVPEVYNEATFNNNNEVLDKGTFRTVVEGKVNTTIPGFTGTAFLGAMIQTQAQADADGAPPEGYLQVISDATPAKVVASATITMEGWKMYDDETADAGTITLSDCDPGETLTVYINRASAPTLAGTGLTFNQLPNTTAFAAATQMAIYFEVSHDGTTVDYFYFER
ncbi:autotransporter outer membrane beta-barrel domain-containing protein [Robiginitalea biformata]|uniref:Uncharacterized protein n=1 Tax=Robiginitalea biformata (strain ATCC BAA-864 / DSM 15991 / KCTC 12146 / HTCC2501) TaxID=313596 RepID=A4CKP6_ROBBH|nr:hypothetical protein [Robiginitalea biformata]EAR15445.1 hypothetical protein RB2501_13994 [Robiginitalea biformata HTCC2501]